VDQLTGGLRSGMGYCGAASIPELQKKARFVRVSSAGHQIRMLSSEAFSENGSPEKPVAGSIVIVTVSLAGYNRLNVSAGQTIDFAESSAAPSPGCE